jgi:hypothetical protein
MDIKFILNDALNKALCSRDRIKHPNSNKIADFVNKYVESEQLILHGVVFNEASSNSKEHQEKLLREMMQNDEELGIYSEVELCECGGNKRVGLDCTMKPCNHPYYKKISKHN